MIVFQKMIEGKQKIFSLLGHNLFNVTSCTVHVYKLESFVTHQDVLKVKIDLRRGVFVILGP